MKAEIKIEIPDELVRSICKEWERVNDPTAQDNPEQEKRREKLYKEVQTKLVLFVAKEFQRKFKSMILKANP